MHHSIAVRESACRRRAPPPAAAVAAPALDAKTLLPQIVTFATIGYFALRLRGSLQ